MGESRRSPFCFINIKYNFLQISQFPAIIGNEAGEVFSSESKNLLAERKLNILNLELSCFYLLEKLTNRLHRSAVGKL